MSGSDEVIVSAANKSPDGLVIMCVRHGCDLFFGVVDTIFDSDKRYHDWEQGFVTSNYRFVDRNEAWRIAMKQNQIKHRVGGDSSNGGTLYSENLY